MGRILRILGILFALGALAWGTVLFTVDQTEVAIVLRLGKPVGGPRSPGLHVRIPLVESVVVYDARQLEYDAEAREVISKDKKNLKVDNYARWQIVDPLKFYQTVRDERGAQSRLDDIIYSQVREQLGKYTLLEIVAEKRSEIMAEVTERTREAAAEFGIAVVDVRIKRADLPPANEKAVYARMQAERKRQAHRYRAEGEEAAREVRSQADKEKAILLAEAYRKAQEIRGEGDAEATRIFAEAFGQDPEFYDFMRSLEIYREGIKKGDVLLLSPTSQLFRYLAPVGSGP
ncbi:MAG: protease modulator HflC [Deltaproteobacteria bacterium]|nr:protease modulator HflC [Deltaproteobacteria bacterium]